MLILSEYLLKIPLPYNLHYLLFYKLINSDNFEILELMILKNGLLNVIEIL